MTVTKTTQFKEADLLKIHADRANENYHWLSILKAKEVYSQSKTSILDVCHTYGIPLRQLSTHGQLLMSQPCFDHILTHAKELASTSQEDTGQARLQRLRAEAENEVRADLKREFKAKLEAASI